MPDSVAQKSIKRFQFLKRLYDETGGSRDNHFFVTAIGESLGLNNDEAHNIFDYLEGEGLVEATSQGTVAGITHAGIVEIEQVELSPQQPTQHFPANIINIHGSVIGAAFQVGNTNSTQTANLNISAQDIQGLVTWLDKLKESISSLGLTEENRQAMTRSVTALENEIQEPEPDKSVLKIALGRVQGLLEGVGTHMVAVQLLNELPAVMHHLHL